ncbi:Peptidoglycan/LPS O-acetylase OafA/YrhL, contains acyltransferase and SGNH-hydrolase domains [Chitinophaga jiangningensis]|uniref:Peptidoglycan/LPS O-acetylase OafA/YrhL, contains acyltransferase and SGNH-hydrolase domains n=1 Tax=Chitinophaga jiangningensis TaxID=1419482 RepID=A0A1M6ZYM9_9BACT|nr:acyltransferase [Chitinophaga jiangningensis]SHL35591.1 Peptidoglycan/LPS O-acetylase OafA/YrhL, contains acyltransferase and SGNH-hydrolase domains [Chitinophaga jiangningensis]
MEKDILKSRQHYEVLDGLRGIAALSIVVFHLYEFMVPDYTKSPIGHGYLAVDFFFCLSGFVIGYAYDERALQLGLKTFFRNRLIRLHPMVILGSVLGVAGYLLDPYIGAASVAEAGYFKIVLAFVCSLLVLPFPWLPGRGNGLFPYNTPVWSLLMEYIINIFYALVLLRTPKRWLLVMLGVSAVWIALVARHRGWIITGWDGPTFTDGFARVFFSFLAGLTVYRFNLMICNRINFLLLGATLIGVFMFPHFNNDWIIEMILVMLVFPFLLALGAGTTATGWVRSFCVFTGRLSYPLYMTHIWMVWLFGNYLTARKPGPAEMYLVAAGVVVAAIALGYVSLRFYDEPLRKWLTARAKVVAKRELESAASVS